LLGRVQETFDDIQRTALLAEASELAMADLGAIPVYYPVPIFGMRKSLTFDVTSAAHSLAGNIHPAKRDE
jgi:hypothetical protein